MMLTQYTYPPKYGGGYFYIVIPTGTVFVKMGYTEGERKKLISRYGTYYGSNVEYLFFQTEHPKYVEKRMFEVFIGQCIENELFTIENLWEYITVATQMCEKKCCREDRCDDNVRSSGDVGSDNLYNEISKNTNGLENFITYGNIKLEKGLYCKKEEFLQECRTHCEENGFPWRKLTKDFYTPPFQKHGLSMSRGAKLYPIKNGEGQTTTKATWIEGCGFIDVRE